MPENSVETLRSRLRAAVARSKTAAHVEEWLAATEPFVLFAHPPAEPLDVEGPRYVHLGRDLVAKIRAAQEDANRRVLDRLPLGAGRLGGVPDLPPGLPWPEAEGKKLPFLAQIDLAEIPRWEGNPLPVDGWLYVFLLWDDEHDPSPLVVQHHRGRPDELVRAPWPEDGEVWPDWNGTAVYELLPLIDPTLGLDIDAWRLERVLKARGVDPRSVWDRIREVTRAAAPLGADKDAKRSAGWLLGQVAGVDGTAASIAEEEAPGEDWTLLLAIQSAGTMEWSDSGTLYLLIPRSDLAAGDFSRILPAVRSG